MVMKCVTLIVQILYWATSTHLALSKSQRVVSQGKIKILKKTVKTSSRKLYFSVVMVPMALSSSWRIPQLYMATKRPQEIFYVWVYATMALSKTTESFLPLWTSWRHEAVTFNIRGVPVVAFVHPFVNRIGSSEPRWNKLVQILRRRHLDLRSSFLSASPCTLNKIATWHGIILTAKCVV